MLCVMSPACNFSSKLPGHTAHSSWACGQSAPPGPSLLFSYSSPSLDFYSMLLPANHRKEHLDYLYFMPEIAQCSNSITFSFEASCSSRKSTAPPSLILSASLLMGYSIPASGSWIKILNSTGPSIQPQGHHQWPLTSQTQPLPMQSFKPRRHPAGSSHCTPSTASPTAGTTVQKDAVRDYQKPH